MCEKVGEQNIGVHHVLYKSHSLLLILKQRIPASIFHSSLMGTIFSRSSLPWESDKCWKFIHPCYQVLFLLWCLVFRFFSILLLGFHFMPISSECMWRILSFFKKSNLVFGFGYNENIESASISFFLNKLIKILNNFIVKRF